MTEFWKDPRDVHMTQAYLVRSHGDWLVGMNATRSLTVKIGTLMRVGRVKAPTLRLVYLNPGRLMSLNRIPISWRRPYIRKDLVVFT